MPPAASRILQARPAFVRHLLLSNRIQYRSRSWKSWFKDEIPEQAQNKPTNQVEQPTYDENHGDPIPRKEDILKKVDKNDLLKAVTQGPNWFENLFPVEKRPVFEEEEGDDDDPTIKKKKRRTFHSIEKQERHVKRKIKQLEKSIGLDKDEWHYHRMSYAEMPPEARQGFLQVMGKTKEEVEGDEVLMPASAEQQVTLQGLNECLVKAGKNSEDMDNGRELWRYYCRCKWRIPNFLEHVTDRVWALLWQTQNIDSYKNPNRFAHLRVLTDDMRTVHKRVSPEQGLATVEATFQEGEQDEAVWSWEEWYEETLAKKQVPAPEAVELGIRMHCRMDNLERVEELVRYYFTRYPDPDARILFPVIDMFARSSEESAHRQAFLYYVDLKRRLDKNITMKDYDLVSLSFFRGQLSNLALTVFVDLMNSPTSPFKGEDLEARAQHRVQEIVNMSGDTSTANAASLTGLSILPPRLQNKFFFGSWLKKLIGLGETDAAAQVIELMFERGIAPAPLHINGFCSALFRTGKDEDKEAAERMIQAMIQRRMSLVEERRKLKGKGWKQPELPYKVQLDEEGNPIPKFLERPIPAATAETFGILAQHYRRTGRAALVLKLHSLMQSVEVHMNQFFLTQYLKARMSLMKHHQNIYRLFEDVTTWYPPSIYCYDQLWKSLLFRAEKTRFEMGTLTPRKLFAHQSSWWQGVPDDIKDHESKFFDERKYNLVVHCFLRVRDLPGAMAAMHGMKHLFNAYPTGETIKELVRGLAMISFKNPTSNLQRMRIIISKAYDENVQATFVVLQALYEEMTGQEFEPRFTEGEIPDDNYGDPEQTLKLLTQLVWVFAARTRQHEVLRKEVWIAKNNMGLDQLKIGRIGDFVID